MCAEQDQVTFYIGANPYIDGVVGDDHRDLVINLSRATNLYLLHTIY